MRLLRDLKTVYKGALRSGKIIYVGVKERQTAHIFVAKQLIVKVWKHFELKERLFGKGIASNRINYGDFRCNGDIKLWFKVVRILCGVFYKGGHFRQKKTGDDNHGVNAVYKVLC